MLHTQRGPRHYTALFSNTQRAHEMGTTRDWVILYYDGDAGERQCTFITAEWGAMRGRRIVRGREAECLEHYRRRDQPAPAGGAAVSRAGLRVRAAAGTDTTSRPATESKARS